MMKLDNFLRGPVTSILGLLIMCVSAWMMILGKLEVLWEGSAIFVIGFSVLFLKDDLPGFIKRLFNRKLK